MPNWCATGLRITATTDEQKEKLKELNSHLTNNDKQGLCSFFYPCPEELKNTTAGFFGDTDEQRQLELQQESNLKKYGHKDWYDWQVNTWGTKWDPDVTDFDYQPDTGVMTCFFDTAWSPPIAFYNSLYE